MAKEDYTTTRGALKLKGVKDAGVDKKKKKKKQKAKDDGAGTQLATTSGDGEGADEEETSAVLEPAGDEAREPYRGNRDDGKTEAERRYEETRRRRLNERLAREGVKTHKERVEELNKYLSTLSEHHDMPRIGPG